MAAGDGEHWLDVVILYQQRLEAIYRYLLEQDGGHRDLWQRLVDSKRRLADALQGFKARLTQGAVQFDRTVPHTGTIQSAVEYMAFIVRGLAIHKYPLRQLVSLSRDFEQNLLDSRFFLALRTQTPQDGSLIEAWIREIDGLQHDIAERETAFRSA